MRLDLYLLEHNLASSRNKAQELIKEGIVLVDSKVVRKSSYKLELDQKVQLLEHKSYVSRAAYKLLHFLEKLSLDLHEIDALDIGASTGGFTQVLLEAGVAKVVAVDVGKDQLHTSIKDDPRVLSYESCDIRNFKSDTAFELIVSDVSFISLHNILEDINRLAKAHIILLFKPQFEVGKDIKRDKNGVVTDQKAIKNAREVFEKATQNLGWELVQQAPSEITGKEGNLEYCYYFKK